MLKKILHLLILCLLAGGVLADVKVANDPTRIGVGARLLGMGKSYLGLADDINGLFIDPAALAAIKQLQLTSLQGRFLNEYNYINFGSAFPSQFGTFGIGYVGSNISFTGPSSTTEVIDGVRIIPSTTEGVSYTFLDSVYLLSWGKDFFGLGTGATLKIFALEMGGPGISQGTASGTELDLGLHYKLPNAFKTGVVIQNALPFSTGGRIRWANGTVETLPSVWKAGLSWQVLGQAGFKKNGQHEVSINLDGDFTPLRPNIPNLWHLGVEWSPVSVTFLRAGIDQDYVGTTGGTGLQPTNNLTLGVGLLFGQFRFDYAFHQYDQVNENNTHYFSLTYGVGPTINKEIKSVIVNPVIPQLFSDVPSDYWAFQQIETLASLNIINGYPDGTFNPEGEITRAEFTKLLIDSKRNVNLSAEEINYTDIAATHWAAKEIAFAAQAGYVQGFPDYSFRPNNPVTRAEGVAIISRFLKLPVVSLDELPYSDLPGRYWATEDIAKAKTAGLLKFITDEQFIPDKPLTRAEVASLVYNCK